MLQGLLISKNAAGETFEALRLGLPGISNISFVFPILFFWTPPNNKYLFFLGINTEFRDEPITLLDTSFLLSIGWSSVSISRDNLPKMMVNQHFTIYYESFKRQDSK